MPELQLDGRVAVVTGAGSGIGRATVLALHRAGARVFAGDLRFPDETDVEFHAAKIETRICDVRSDSDLRALIDGAAEEGGRLDLLVNNAGIGMTKPIDEVDESDWSACMDTNLKGPFFGSKHAIRHMRKQAMGGAIVNTASNAGLLPRAHDPVYSLSKMALVAMTRSLALCHGRDRIRINCVCPGPVEDTGMMNADLDQASDREALVGRFLSASPLASAFGRMIAPAEVAAAILYLASDAAAMVTGTAIAIDGGKSLGVPPQS